MGRWCIRGAWPSILMSAGSVAFAPAVCSETGGARTWTFEEHSAGSSPTGFLFARTGAGRPGRWVIQAVGDAPSGTHVLAQVDADATDNRFPIAVASEPKLRDVRLSVKCKPVSGEVDQACGLVFRFRDARSYYLTRANALEGNVRLYRVVHGTRRQFASWSGAVTTGAWHDLRVVAQGDHLQVSWDGQPAIDAHDQTFNEAGQIGVWTKADSVTSFDDLRVEPLGGSP